MPIADAMTNSAEVLVVGGGLAGLAALSAFLVKGVDAKLIEANDRLGGRVLSETPIRGLTFDLGAQLISRDHHRVLSVAHAAGAEVVWRSENETISEGFREVAGNRFGWRDAMAKCEKHCSLAGMTLAYYANLLGLFTSRSGESAEAFLGRFTFSKAGDRLFQAKFSDAFCSHPSEISGREVFAQLRTMGGPSAAAHADAGWLPQGASALVKHLSSGIIHRIHLGRAVRSVRRYGSGLSIETTTGSISTRRIILAIPPPLLMQVDLSAVIPSTRLADIRGFARGRVIKTILAFDTPWWRERARVRRHFTRPAGMFSEGLDASPPSQSRGVMVLFSTGRSADRLSRISPDEADRIDSAIQWLACASQKKPHSIVAGRSIDWSQERFALGGHASRPGVGVDADVAQIFSSQSSIHFAGSETADN